VALAALVTLSLTLWQSRTQTRLLGGDPEACFLGSDVPLLTNYDGYHYLRLTRAALAGEPTPSRPLLVTLTGALSRLTGASPEAVAFALPPFLAWISGLAVLAWAAMAGGPVLIVVAGLAVGLCPYWIDDTGAGRFDTDGLIPFFLYACALALHGAAFGTRRARAFGLGAFAILAWAFARWWPPGLALAGLCLGGYALSACFPQPRAMRLVKLGLGLVLLVLLGAVLADAGELFPRWLGQQVHYAHVHLGFVTRLDAAKADVAASIRELRGLDYATLGRQAAGSLPTLAAALAGLAWLLWRSPRAACSLAPLLLLAGLSLRANRFLIVAFPLLALGLGAFVERFVWTLPFWRGPGIVWRNARVLVTAAVAASLLWPSFTQLLHYAPERLFTRAHDRLARSIREHSPAQALIWCWWDDGYFLQAQAGRRTFIDGGAQTPDRIFVTAFPLATADAVLARNWIRFFATHGINALHRLDAAYGTRELAVSRLIEALSGRTPHPDLARALGLADHDAVHAFLFPRADVLLYLPVDLLLRSGHWLAMGATPGHPAPPPGNHVDLFPGDSFSVNPADNALTLSPACRAKGYVHFPGVFLVDARGLNFSLLARVPDPFLILREGSPWAFVVDRPAIHTMAFRLLSGIDPNLTTFRPLRYEPASGGVWQVD